MTAVPSLLNSIQNSVHRSCALNRRIRVLARELATLIPENSTVLDVGTGSGEIARQIIELKRGVTIRAIDTVVRDHCAIPVEPYDGSIFPFADGTFDYVIVVDVLHHADDPLVVMREAFRVARRAVIIKDHVCNSWFARRVMSCTDWFANYRHSVSLPFNFWSTAKWREAWKSLGTSPVEYRADFGLYPWISYLLFSREMDFIAKLSLPANR